MTPFHCGSFGSERRDVSNEWPFRLYICRGIHHHHYSHHHHPTMLHTHQPSTKKTMYANKWTWKIPIPFISHTAFTSSSVASSWARNAIRFRLCRQWCSNPEWTFTQSGQRWWCDTWWISCSLAGWTNTSCTIHGRLEEWISSGSKCVSVGDDRNLC